MLIQIKVPKEIGLKQRIVDKYTYLYQEYRRFYPERKDYTYQQLRKNIADVASIVNKSIDSHDIHISTFIPWLDNDRKQYYFCHWYFALSIEIVDGAPIAIVKDAHYESEHHNDILLSKPYDIEDVLNK